MTRQKLFFICSLAGLIILSFGFSTTELPKMYKKGSSSIFAKDTTKSGIRIQKTNWSNSMGCTFQDDLCVELGEDNILRVKLIVTVGVPDINPFPPMHFFYFFPDNQPQPLIGHTDAVTNGILDLLVLSNGDSVWQAYFLFEFDFDDLCMNPDINDLRFGVYHQLRMREPDGSFFPYPVAEHPDLFPPDIFQIHHTGLAEYIYFEKEICCEGGSQPCEEEDVSNMIAPDLDLMHDNDLGTINNLESSEQNDFDIKLFPNPFSSEVNIQSKVLDIEEELTLTVYDAYGKMLKMIAYSGANFGGTFPSVSTADWPSGIYYFHFSTKGKSYVKKSVKH